MLFRSHGIDYDKTFSPVAMLKSIRILLAIVAYYDYEIWQMDVKTAFLNGNLLNLLVIISAYLNTLKKHMQHN